jgi:hypothetical protein
MSDPTTIVVGAGVAGIAMGHTLKWKLGYSNFEVCRIAISSPKAKWSDIIVGLNVASKGPYP